MLTALTSTKKFPMPTLPRYPLPKLLEREANNLDLIRLLCACLVIFGHAALIIDDPAHPFGDPLSRWLNYEGVYAGSIAVRVFFFISGLLVTDSLLRKQSIPGFMVGRIMRVWPALSVLLVATTFLVGPFLTRYDSADYFTHPATFRYLRDNFLLTRNQYLPGVFPGEIPPREINSPLWTLGAEVTCYAVLLGLYALRAITRPLVGLVITVCLLVEALLPHSVLFHGLDANYQVRYLPCAFALGALLAIYKKKITLGIEAPAIAALVFLIFKTSLFGQHLFFIFLFITVLYSSALPLVRKLKLGSDLSYGTYLWGFLIQQIVASRFAQLGYAFNLFTSLVLSIGIAYLSWHLIEKHAIAAGHRWAVKLQSENLRCLVEKDRVGSSAS